MATTNKKTAYTILFAFEMIFSLIYSVTFNFMFSSPQTPEDMELTHFFIFGCAMPGILLAFTFSIAIFCLNNKYHLLSKSAASLLCGSHALYVLIFLLAPMIFANDIFSNILRLLLMAAVICTQIIFLLKFVKINPEKTYPEKTVSNNHLTAKKSMFWIISIVQAVVAVYGALNFFLLATNSKTLEAIFEKIGLETYYEAVGFIGLFCLIGISISSVVLILINSKCNLMPNTPYFLTVAGVVIWGVMMLTPSFISQFFTIQNEDSYNVAMTILLSAPILLILAAQIYIIVELIKISRKKEITA